MNLAKKDDGWVLCPSKSIPGKYYYFNVVSGEAVWSLPDAKKPDSTGRICDETNKPHNYPEPDAPAECNEIINQTPDSNNSPQKKINSHNISPQNKIFLHNNSPQKVIFTHNNSPQKVIFTHNNSPQKAIFSHNNSPQKKVISPIFTTINKQANTPIFGKISFPNYVPRDTSSISDSFLNTSNICTFNRNMPMFGQTKIIWAPMPLMMIEQKAQPTLNQNTQTDLEKDMFVHTCQMPLSKRFGKYEKMKIETESVPIFSSTPIKTLEPINPTVGTKRRPVIRNAILNIDNKIDINSKICQNKVEIKQNSFVPNTENNQEELTLEGLKLYDNNCDTKIDNVGRYEKLQSGDLRLFLMARKRRYTEGENSSSAEMKRIKLNYRDDHAEPLPKKRVTFKLNDELDTPQTNQVNVTDLYPKHTIEALRKLSKFSMTKEWYILADTNVLLQGYEFVNKLVQSDPNCRLLIPECIRSKLEVLSSGDSFGSKHVFTARHITRMLKHPPSHVVNGMESEGNALRFYNDTNIASNDTLLNCCLQKMQQKHHVVLITNNEALMKQASSLHIHVFNLKTIKESGNFTLDTTSKSQTFAIGNKATFTRTQRILNNISGLNEVMRTNKNSIFDNDSDITETSFDNSRVINNINLKLSSFNTPSIKAEDQKFEIQDGGPNSNVTNNKSNCFLFQKLRRGSLKTFEVQTPKADFEQNKFEFQSQNLKIKKEEPVQNGDSSIFKPFISNAQLRAINERKNIELSVEDDLRRFVIQHKVTEERITGRIDEWICIFIQIMEDALSNVLQNSSFRSDLVVPWNFNEMLNRVGMLYEEPKIKVIVEKLLASLAKCNEKGKVKNTVKPQDLLRTIGCGTLLIQFLTIVQPDCEELSSAKRSLTNLLRTIEDPNEVEFIENTSRGNIDSDKERRQNYVKEPREIINYLKRHYEEWKDFDVSKDLSNTQKTSLPSTHDDAKIFRISGKNLNTLRIDSNKAITVVNNDESIIKNNTELKAIKNDITTKDVAKTIILQQGNTEDKKSPNKNVVFNVKSAENNLKVKEVSSLEPKIVRRVSVIDYEEKIKRTSFDMDRLDYSGYDSDYGKNMENNVNTQKEVNIKNKDACDNSHSKMNVKQNNGIGTNYSGIGNNYSGIGNNDSGRNKVDSTTGKDSMSEYDSGIDNESCMTYSFVKNFLAEMSGTFKSVHGFIDENLDDFRRDQNFEDINLHTKLNNVRNHIGGIIEKLKNIVQREANEAALNNLMIKMEEAANDKRITRYRSVMRKCLEQAQNLQNALKIMLSLTDKDFDGSLSIRADSTTSSIRYLNIFE